MVKGRAGFLASVPGTSLYVLSCTSLYVLFCPPSTLLLNLDLIRRVRHHAQKLERCLDYLV